MMSEISPSRVLEFTAGPFTGDMGDVSDPEKGLRFTLDADRWLVQWLRVRFTGGTGSADLSLRVDHRSNNQDLDFTLATVKAAGTDGEAIPLIRPAPGDELPYMLFRGDAIVPEWTNPDPGSMRWSLSIGLADLTGL